MTDLTTLHSRVKRGLDYRVKALLSTHYYGNQQPWQRWVRRRRFRNCMLDLPRREPELAALLRRGMEITNRDPDRPNSRHSDALFLLDAVMRLRPARVLECGAGLSTLIVAYALDKLAREHGHEAELVSMDESGEYLEKMVAPILPAGLAQRVTLTASPVAYWSFENTRSGAKAGGIGYANLPALDFDFIYVDGPQVRQGHYEALVRVGKGAGVPDFLDHKPFDCDALNVAIDHRRAVTFAIDQRIDTRWQIQSFLDRPYRSTYHFAPRKSLFVVTPEATRHVRRTRLDIPSP